MQGNRFQSSKNIKQFPVLICYLASMIKIAAVNVIIVTQYGYDYLIVGSFKNHIADQSIIVRIHLEIAVLTDLERLHGFCFSVDR